MEEYQQRNIILAQQRTKKLKHHIPKFTNAHINDFKQK